MRRGRLAKLRRSVVAREAAVRRRRPIRRRGLLARLMPVTRTTFVIDTDRTVLKVISSELRAWAHTLRFLHNLNAARRSPRIQEKHTDAQPQSEGKSRPIGDRSRNRKPRASRASSGRTR